MEHGVVQFLAGEIVHVRGEETPDEKRFHLLNVPTVTYHRYYFSILFVIQQVPEIISNGK